MSSDALEEEERVLPEKPPGVELEKQVAKARKAWKFHLAQVCASLRALKIHTVALKIHIVALKIHIVALKIHTVVRHWHIRLWHDV